MLVLSRRKREQIVIGDNIVLTVVMIRGDKVRLGIDAPREVTVRRPRKPEKSPRHPEKNDADGS